LKWNNPLQKWLFITPTPYHKEWKVRHCIPYRMIQSWRFRLIWYANFYAFGLLYGVPQGLKWKIRFFYLTSILRFFLLFKLLFLFFVSSSPSSPSPCSPASGRRNEWNMFGMDMRARVPTTLPCLKKNEFSEKIEINNFVK